MVSENEVFIHIYWSPWYQIKVVRMITMIIDNDWATVAKWISQEILLRGKGSIISRAGFKSTSWLLKFCTTHHIMYVMQSKKILYSAAEETPKAIPIREEGPKVHRSLKDKISTIGRTTTQNDFCFLILPNFCVLLPGFIRGERKGKPKPALLLSATERGFKLNFVWKSNENESFDLLGLSWTKMVKYAIFFISFSFEIFHSLKHNFNILISAHFWYILFVMIFSGIIQPRGFSSNFCKSQRWTFSYFHF